MMIQRFVCNPVEVNCYLIWDEDTKQAAIIDCGPLTDSEQQKIHDSIESQGLHLQYLLQTHMHFDHIFGLPAFAERYQLSPMCHADDIIVYKKMPQMVSQFLGMEIPGILPDVKETLKPNQILPLGNTQIKVLLTPGHTPGGVCFWIEASQVLFSGDTLFRGSVGRTDLPGGDMDQEINSILSQLLTLPKETMVYPGHGPQTNIGWEMTNNPYF